MKTPLPRTIRLLIAQVTEQAAPASKLGDRLVVPLDFARQLANALRRAHERLAELDVLRAAAARASQALYDLCMHKDAPRDPTIATRLAAAKQSLDACLHAQDAPEETPGPAIVLPKEPPRGLLISMALRTRHDFGLLPEAEQERLIQSMRPLYEEVSGHGFWHPDKAGFYDSLLRRSDPHTPSRTSNSLTPTSAST